MNNQEIIQLYNNDKLKQQFIKNYCSASFSANAKWSAQQAEQNWTDLFKQISAAYSDKSLTPIYLASKQDMIASMLYVSETGLSLNPHDKEVYFRIDYAEGGRAELKTGLGYKGMTRIAMGTGFFKYITTELVFEGDTFNWQGQDVRPYFMAAGPSTNRPLQCAYVGFIYKDGDGLYIKLEADELLEVERASKAYLEITAGTDADSLYNTPWRKRLFEIAAWRLGYNRMREIILFGSVRSQAKIDLAGNVNLEAAAPDDFMSVFEQESA